MMSRLDIHQQIDNNFRYHPPKGTQVERYEAIRSEAKEFADRLAEMCPESDERTRALQKLEECVMLANASIARNE